jgi:hypothetical protein
MHGFVAIHGSRQIDVYAESLFQAKQKAIAQLKVRKSQEHMISVMIAERDVDPVTMKGTQVVHSTAGL